MFILIIETLNKVWNTFKLTTATRTIPVTFLWYPSYFWTYWALSENFVFIASEQTLQNNCFFLIFVKSKRNSKFFEGSSFIVSTTPLISTFPFQLRGLLYQRPWIIILQLSDMLSDYARVCVCHFNSMSTKNSCNVGTYKHRQAFRSL